MFHRYAARDSSFFPFPTNVSPLCGSELLLVSYPFLKEADWVGYLKLKKNQYPDITPNIICVYLCIICANLWFLPLNESGDPAIF